MNPDDRHARTGASVKTIKLKQLMIDSPYQPQIPKRMTWTASSLKTFRSDRRKFFWKYIMRIRPQGAADKNLLIGSGLHRCLGAWYRGRRSAMTRIASVFETQLMADAQLSEHYLDQKDFDALMVAVGSFRGMVIGYSRVYADDRATWQIERGLIEKKFMVNCGEFDFAGMIDLVIRRKPGSSRFTFVEHKTASKIRTQQIERLPLDTQIRGYGFGLRNGLKVPVNDVLYDIVGKCKLRRKSNETVDDFTDRIALAYETQHDKYFYREPLPFQNEDIAAFEYEMRQTHREYQFILEGHQGDPKDPRTWGPNDKVCDEYFRVCPYLPCCIQGLSRSTARLYEQGEVLHEELAEADE
jgi:hypothetical protein